MTKNDLKSRIWNWKFNQALTYKNELKHNKSKECLKLLSKLWGDTGVDGGGTLAEIIRHLVDYILLLEGWD